jgi:membrane fusion protein (multidrug efflux system)
MTPPDQSSEPPRESRHDLGFSLPAPAKLSTTAGIALALLALLLVAGVFLIGYLPKRESKQELARSSRVQQTALTRVETVEPKLLESMRALVLPGSIQPMAETVLYPRADGYIESFEVDIGDKVEEGQLVAVIETPELDQQLDQARAQLAAAQANALQARASRDYSLTTLDRYKRLRPAGVASQQEVDQRESEATVNQSTVAAAEAAVEVQRAELRRLARLKSFTRVTAPFAGLITQRNIDRGALVSAGNASPLFRLISTDPVRVMLQVPQDVAPSVRAGVPASVSVREFAGRKFEGSLKRAAFALDSQTRTMLTEVHVPNPKGELLTGMYAEVSIELPAPHRVYEVPATALYNDANGLRLAVVGAGDTVHFTKITIERDTGATVQIATGLQGGERIVRIATASIREGSKVDRVE